MKQEILHKIKEYETIIIHRHIRPDPDAYGSQGGLAEIIKSTFPEKKVFLAGKDDATLTYLNKMDSIPDIVYNGALVIVCDTANQERICDQRYSLGDFLIKIDHHPNDDAYGDLQWVDTGASSTSEMIYELYLAGKEDGFQLNTTAARLLYAGIVGDTGRFLYQSTTEKTFRYASELIKYPFSRTELYEKMYEITENIAKLQGYILQNFEMDELGLAKIMISKKQLKSYQLKPQEVAKLVSSIGHIKGLLAWAFFIEEEKGHIRVRLRSKGPVINEVAKKYNGGGHPFASGATIYSWDDVERVMIDLRKVAKKFLEGNLSQ